MRTEILFLIWFQTTLRKKASTGERKSQRNETLRTAMSIERRLHPRILVNWPATLHYVQGSIEGESKNISVDGVFMFLSEKPKFGVNFPILLKPSEERSISVVGKKVWSGTFNIDSRPVFGMGIRFIFISPEDRQFISTLVEKESRVSP